MKKLLLAGVLALVSVGANAENWEYKLSKSDFSSNYKTATLRDKEKGYLLSIDLDEKTNDINNSAIVSIKLPKGVVASSECRRGCYAEINVDGQKNAYPPIYILGFSNFKSYGVTHSSLSSFIDILKKSKVVKVQLPTFRGYDVVTFTSDKPFDPERFLNIK